MISMMAVFQRRIDQKIGTQSEQMFFATCLRCLRLSTKEKVELDPWTVTSFEIEMGKKIGEGGL